MTADNMKYRQVEDYLKNEILSGHLKINDQIMTEEQLCAKFGFSRMTISKALLNLVNDGFIVRTPGKGSFVTNHHVTKPLESGTSFTEDMRRIGMKAGSQLLDYKIIHGRDNRSVAAKLDLGDNDITHYFIRLRTGDGKPIAISYTYISAKVIPAIDVNSLTGSFYAYIRTIGIRMGAATRYEFNAIKASPEQKKQLRLTDEPILSCRHITYATIDGVDVPFEYIDTCYNGMLYTYQINGLRTIINNE